MGHLAWIGVRPAHDAPIVSLREAELVAERGVAGDRAAVGRIGGKRQVTLLQREHLPVIAVLSGRAEVFHELLRRNLVVAGINILALKSLRFAIGEEVELEGTAGAAKRPGGPIATMIAAASCAAAVMASLVAPVATSASFAESARSSPSTSTDTAPRSTG